MKYYKICLRHMGDRDSVFLLWGHNSSGYTRCIENAGLYEYSEKDISKQIYEGDFLVSEDIVNSLKQFVRLPIYGDVVETYAGFNEFFVLPNTGQVRKSLGITSLDFRNTGNYDSFNVRFKNTFIEKYKYIYDKGTYICSLKENNPFIDEFWYYQNDEYHANTRDEAIFRFIKERELQYAANEWQFKNRNRFYDRKDIEMKDILLAKKYVSCKIKRVKILDKWEKL